MNPLSNSSPSFQNFEEDFLIVDDKKVENQETEEGFVVIEEGATNGDVVDNQAYYKHKVENLMKTASTGLTVIQNIPIVPTEFKEGITQVNATIKLATNTQDLQKETTEVPKEEPSSWDKAKRFINIADLAQGVVTHSFTIAKPFLPQLANAAIPGSGIVCGIATGISYLNTAITAAEFIQKAKTQES